MDLIWQKAKFSFKKFDVNVIKVCNQRGPIRIRINGSLYIYTASSSWHKIRIRNHSSIYTAILDLKSEFGSATMVHYISSSSWYKIRIRISQKCFNIYKQFMTYNLDPQPWFNLYSSSWHKIRIRIPQPRLNIYSNSWQKSGSGFCNHDSFYILYI